MVRPYTWLLDRVGSEGIRLTAAGYLPPVHVAAALADLGLAEELSHQGNRESYTWPVLHLRESAQKMGLVRKYRGDLRQTAIGRKFRDDPVALWWHLSRRMPLRSADAFELQAGLLILLAIAGEVADIAMRRSRTFSARSVGRCRTERRRSARRFALPPGTRTRCCVVWELSPATAMVRGRSRRRQKECCLPGPLCRAGPRSGPPLGTGCSH
jgi:hypothetical protein